LCPWHPLHLSRTLYKFTPFMQNKPNFRNAQMNVSTVITKDYENIANCKLCENKPNTNPIQTQSKPIQTQSKPIQSQSKPIQSQSKPIKANTKPIQSQYKPNSRNVQIAVTLVITMTNNNEQRTMNYELLFKTNPIQTQFQTASASNRRIGKHQIIQFFGNLLLIINNH